MFSLFPLSSLYLGVGVMTTGLAPTPAPPYHMTKPLLATSFTSAMTALAALANARGHVMGVPLRDDKLSAAAQCKRCERWLVFSIPEGTRGEPAELRGDALGTCPGTQHRPVTNDNGLRSMTMADGTMADGTMA